MENRQLFLILHDIRSAHNVGAVFRSADGAGVSKIFLTGYTPVPAKSDCICKTKAEKMLEKTALGAEQSVAWERFENLALLIETLQKENCTIIALEKTADATEIGKYEPSFPAALILGNEVEGVTEDVLKKCDAIISIPMRGKKESLNVSVAAGIAMYGLLK
ncbi:MAG: TrmH family RNA methyltransferase [Candidatus Moranbacteria bacterium]|nr:TrmH family RNA methyltransferase [Candidatus Moranbacteria bacterium]